jgi:hypothetical protein
LTNINTYAVPKDSESSEKHEYLLKTIHPKAKSMKSFKEKKVRHFRMYHPIWNIGPKSVIRRFPVHILEMFPNSLNLIQMMRVTLSDAETKLFLNGT